MTAVALLQRLACLAGLETSYEDAWGERQTLSPERIATLLRALGHPAEGEAELQAAIERLERRPWTRLLEPVFVRRADRLCEVPLVTDREEASLCWRLVREDGAVQEDRLPLAGLPVAARHELDGRRLSRRLLRLPEALPPGYHRLELEIEGEGARCRGTTRLIVAPPRCYLPPGLSEGRRTWGWAVQLYALRSERNWGIGDFADLRRLVEGTAGLGGGVVGLNPLHAGFLSAPERYSPYSPSSRRFLSPLYIDVEGCPDFAECPPAQELVASAAFQKRLAGQRAADLVDYPAVADSKLTVLRRLYESFRQRHLGDGGPPTPRGARFRRFQEERGEALEHFAAIEARKAKDGGALAGMPSEFYAYLQWLAAEQLEAVRSRCEELSLPVGLYLDLAISVAHDGADARAESELFVARASIGAPPDLWNPLGQDWGLPPPHPEVLREQAYRPFIEVLRANMGAAGALRIDHVVALQRLHWIPSERGADEGGYVAYPFEDLLGIVALESHRNRCLVVGEDLGTVPDEVTERLQDKGILSYRLLYFEQDEEGAFTPPEDYPRFALASVSTHDLPTLPGYWDSHDLKLRSRLGLFPSSDHERQAFADRERDRRALLSALESAGLLPGDVGMNGDLAPALVEAIYRYLAKTPAMILMAQFEDLIGQREQVNLPATTGDQHPNWRRKLALPLDDLLRDEGVQALARRLADLRGLSALQAR